jgi:short-subunit dehydrogenase
MDYALLTGASSGIGYEMAQVFAANGHNLILVARSEQKLNELKAQLEQEFKLIKAEVVALDLSNPDSAEQLHKITEERKWNVNILINNAGFGDHGEFVTSDMKKNQEMINLNILTLTKLCHLYLKNMLKLRNGKILNVASTASFQPGPLMTVYYATKAYVLHFSEGLHEELIGTGVTVTALCPGATASGFQAAANLSNVALLDTLKIPSSQEVAEYAYRAMKDNKVVAIHGKLNWIFAVSAGFMPRIFVRKLAKKLQEKRLS